MANQNSRFKKPKLLTAADAQGMLDQAKDHFEVKEALDTLALNAIGRSSDSFLKILQAINAQDSKINAKDKVKLFAIASVMFAPTDDQFGDEIEEILTILDEGSAITITKIGEGLKEEQVRALNPKWLQKKTFLFNIIRSPQVSSAYAEELIAGFEGNWNMLDQNALALALLSKPDVTVTTISEQISKVDSQGVDTLVKTRVLERETFEQLPLGTLKAIAQKVTDEEFEEIEELTQGSGSVSFQNIKNAREIIEEYQNSFDNEFWVAFSNSWEGSILQLKDTFKEVG